MAFISTCDIPRMFLATFLLLHSNNVFVSCFIPMNSINHAIPHMTKSNASKGPDCVSMARRKISLKASADAEEKKEPSDICGHAFVLHCAVDGIAADLVLVKNGNAWEKDSSFELIEKDGTKAKFYETGPPSDAGDALDLFNSFLKQGGESLKGEWSSFRRGKPLLAFDPTSFLDESEDETSKAKVLKELMGSVYSAADEYGVDVAICVPDSETHSSLVNLRNEECPFEGGSFWMLSDSQKESISNLSASAKANRLSIFIGAGVSIPSGAPSWGKLLELLAVKAGMNEEDRENLGSLGFLDQPTILAEDMGDTFKPSIADVINESSRYTPAHALLKNLKCPAVTTNYDSLYEDAATSCEEVIPCLPWDSREMISNGNPVRNSLLKLHGCVNYPESIVLSREDYMRFADNQQALRGRLQGIFLTSEILFCGFSMTDDNVHKVIDDVRKVVYKDGEPVPGEKFGTILKMTENKMFNRLWDQDFDIQTFGKSWGDNPSWYHDCFLDALVTEAV